MAETLVLALGVPALLVAAWLMARRSWSFAAADIRGIALQTVIVIVVMLVIAGGVAGVLLSRGGEVIGELEAQEIGRTISSTSTCEAAGQDLLGSALVSVTTTGSVDEKTGNVIYWLKDVCTVNGVVTTDSVKPIMSAGACRLYQAADGSAGTYTARPETAGNDLAETCSVG